MSMNLGGVPNAKLNSDQFSYEFDAFISYRRSDGAGFANKLRRKLQAYVLPKQLRHLQDRKLKVFVDKVYERGAHDFFERNILPALLSSKRLIVLATPDAISRRDGQDWIQREVDEFRAHRGIENVLVVRVAGDLLAELPGDLTATAPNIQIIDLRNQGLLSTIAPTSSARISDEWVKLIAPLFDVTQDDMPILRRERELAQQRLFAIVGGGVLGGVAFSSAFAWYAISEQRKAQRVLDNSLFAAARVIDTASEIRLAPKYRSEQNIVLMTACDLFDGMANAEMRSRYEVSALKCDLDRLQSLIRDRELDRADSFLSEIEPLASQRFESSKSQEWAVIQANVIVARDEVNQGGGMDFKGKIESTKNSIDKISALLRLGSDRGLTDLYVEQVERLCDRLESSDDNRASGELAKTASVELEGAAERMGAVKGDLSDESSERQLELVLQAIRFNRRSALLAISDSAGLLSSGATTSRTLNLIQTGIQLASPGSSEYFELRWEEFQSRGILMNLFIEQKKLSEAIATFRVCLQIANELLGANVEPDRRKTLEDFKGFEVKYSAYMD